MSQHQAVAALKMPRRLLTRTSWRLQHAANPAPNSNTTVTRSFASSSSAPLVQVLSTLPNKDCMDYCRGWAWQQILLSRRLQQRRQPINNDNDSHEDQDNILLLEHNPVYTLGRGASEEHLTFLPNDEESLIRSRLSRKYRGPDAARLSVDRRSMEDQLLRLPSLEEAVSVLASTGTPVLAPNGVPIYRVDRGGEVTFHGPKQLVMYPMLDLKREPFQADLHWFLRQVEEVVIQTLMHYDIFSVRDEINTGVWVGENKIAAVGVSASSWISSHGLALNVAPDLDFFDTSLILPCGIQGRGVTSIQRELQKRGIDNLPTLEEVATVALRCAEEIFRIQIDHENISQIQ